MGVGNYQLLLEELNCDNSSIIVLGSGLPEVATYLGYVVFNK